MGGACSTYGRGKKFVKGKGSLGRPRHRWKYNIRLDLREIVW
jgi:hypothetical protein